MLAPGWKLNTKMLKKSYNEQLLLEMFTLAFNDELLYPPAWFWYMYTITTTYIGKIPNTKLCCIPFISLFLDFPMKYELSHLKLEQNIFKTWPHYSGLPAFLKLYMYLFCSLPFPKFTKIWGEKISITIIQLSHSHLHFLSYISHKRVCFWGNYANIYNPADKSLNLVRCEFWCLRLFSIHGKQTTNDNDGQTFRGLFVAWWWW